MSKIVRRAEFIGKILRKKVADGMTEEFGHRLIRNYNLGTKTSSYCLTMHNIETILL
jgi:hypothetical protein